MQHSSSTTLSSRRAEQLRYWAWSLVLIISIVWVLQLCFVVSAVGRPGQNGSGIDTSMTLTATAAILLLIVSAIGWAIERHHRGAAAVIYAVASSAAVLGTVASVVILAAAAG